jgi:hypothetical protein
VALPETMAPKGSLDWAGVRKLVKINS